MSFTDDPRKVQGKGTAYPVGSPAHEGGVQDWEFVIDESMQPGDTVRVVPPGIPVGPMPLVPTTNSQIEVHVTFTPAQLESMVLRNLQITGPVELRALILEYGYNLRSAELVRVPEGDWVLVTRFFDKDEDE